MSFAAFPLEINQGSCGSFFTAVFDANIFGQTTYNPRTGPMAKTISW